MNCVYTSRSEGMKTKFALAFYYISIGFLTACAVVIVIKLIFWPPCTQTGNTCVIDAWSAAGLEGTILGVSATVLAILGAVAVAGWWTSLNDRVTDQVTKLYNKQKEEVMLPLETDIKQSQRRIDDIKESLNDFETTITESFAALGPLLAEPIAQKAMAADKYPTFPFYMTMSYLTLIKQEEELQHLEREIATYQESINVIQSYINSNIDLSYSVPRTTMESHKGTLLSYLEGFNAPNHIIVLILKDWRRTVYWWKAAKDNRQKTPSLKPEDFDNVQKDFDFYSARMEKTEQDLDKLKSDAQSLLSRVENLLQ